MERWSGPLARSVVVKLTVAIIKGPVRAGCAFVPVSECLKLKADLPEVWQNQAVRLHSEAPTQPQHRKKARCSIQNLESARPRWMEANMTAFQGYLR